MTQKPVQIHQKKCPINSSWVKPIFSQYIQNGGFDTGRKFKITKTDHAIAHLKDNFILIKVYKKTLCWKWSVLVLWVIYCCLFKKGSSSIHILFTDDQSQKSTNKLLMIITITVVTVIKISSIDCTSNNHIHNNNVGSEKMKACRSWQW